MGCCRTRGAARVRGPRGEAACGSLLGEGAAVPTSAPEANAQRCSLGERKAACRGRSSPGAARGGCFPAVAVVLRLSREGKAVDAPEPQPQPRAGGRGGENQAERQRRSSARGRGRDGPPKLNSCLTSVSERNSRALSRPLTLDVSQQSAEELREVSGQGRAPGCRHCPPSRSARGAQAWALRGVASDAVPRRIHAVCPRLRITRKTGPSQPQGEGNRQPPRDTFIALFL